MKASVIHEFGGPEVIHYEDLEVPDVGDDDVLIRVAATSVNPADAAFRSGMLQGMIPVTFPFILGADVAGVVERTGARVSGVKVGDRVYAFIPLGRNGASAEFVTVPADVVALAPKTIPLADAAALPAVALTAWQALFEHGGLQQGQRVLVTAAAGGVGTVAMQIAKAKGAHVVGTASTQRADLLREIGVDEFVDYTRGPIDDAIREPVDLIVNLAPTGEREITRLLALLRPGGVLVSATGPADEEEAKRLGLRTVRMGVQPNAQQLREIAALVDAGKLKPIITARVPVSALADAHRRIGQTYGKVLVTAP